MAVAALMHGLAVGAENFSSYSRSAELMGRTYVHSKVSALVTSWSRWWIGQTEFDDTGKHGDPAIDFAALGEHLYQLHPAARDHGIDIALVILERGYLPPLFAKLRGAYLERHLKFMKGKPWVRHDEHYHVDFRVACKRPAG